MKLMTWILLGWIVAVPALAQDPCAGTSASVTIDEVKAGESTIDAKGTWRVTGGALGVLLEYRVNNDRLRSETWTGTSGTWQITGMDPQEGRCGKRTLRLVIYPSVKEGAHQLNCLSQDFSVAQPFEISCDPIAEIQDCEWRCSEDDGCTGVCTGTARRGRLRYVPFWGLNGEGWQQIGEGPSRAPWTFPVTCVPGQRVSFKVRDHEEGGPWSPVDEIGCGVTE